MKSAYIIKIDPVKESRWGGPYQRIYLRDIGDPNQQYILDITNQCSHWKSFVEIGNYFSHLSVFKNESTSKIHINGKATFIFEGKVVKKQNKKIGFEF